MSHFRPPSLHMTEDQRESVRREKLRCVCPESKHMIACTTFSVADSQLLYLMLVFSLCSFIQHARHGQRWDDNLGGIQTCNCLFLWIQVLNPVINLRQPGMFTVVSTDSAVCVLVISLFIGVIGLLSAEL